MQAKRAGCGFGDTTLAVRFDGCNRMDRESGERWTRGLEEIELDYLEQYTFENADIRICPDPAMLTDIHNSGWRTNPHRDPPHLTANPVAAPLVTVGIPCYNHGAYLHDAIASIAAQTYTNIEVVVIDDGSTDATTANEMSTLAARYPRYHFRRQPNAGIGATRNRCLGEANGEFFVPMDADNVAAPDMIERLVHAMSRNPDYSAMTCYHLAFDENRSFPTNQYEYACRPVGGPHTMASMRNVYGDATAVFRTADLRAIGGYETDRGTSCEDWEVFVKLVLAGREVGVVPEHLLYYRYRPAGFSRITNGYANHQRVLRQFHHTDRLPDGEGRVLWEALLGFQRQVEELTSRQQCLRYRLADRLHNIASRAPRPYQYIKQLLTGRAG